MLNCKGEKQRKDTMRRKGKKEKRGEARTRRASCGGRRATMARKGQMLEGIEAIVP